MRLSKLQRSGSRDTNLVFHVSFYSVPSGVTRRQFLVNILLDVMVQDTGFTVSYCFSKMRLARFFSTPYSANIEKNLNFKLKVVNDSEGGSGL